MKLTGRQLDYYSMSALFIAVKLKSVVIYDLKDFLKVCFNQVNDHLINKVIRAEMSLLGSIFFQLNSCSFYDLICYHLSKIFNADNSKYYFVLENVIHS